MVLVDTHVLVWWVNDTNLLSRAAATAIRDALTGGSEIIVSSISAWEISMLINKGRLVLSMDAESWIDAVMQIEGVRFVPVDHEIGIKSTLLPGEFHKDPADRIIVATARRFAIPLVTADTNLLKYEHVKTIW